MPKKLKILFICQKEYFRQTIYDAIEPGHHEAFYVTSGDPTTISDALEYALRSKNFTHICSIRPEWLSWHPELVGKIRRASIKIIGFSSEPIRHNCQRDEDVHEDQYIRFENLKIAKSVSLDALIHFDASSSDCVLREFGDIAFFMPLPVSSKIFYKHIDVKRKKFDSVFFGRSTEHREAYLSVPKSIHNHLHIAHGLVDEDAAYFTNISNLAINLHNFTYSNFETRVIWSLMCGVPVLTEPLTRTELDGVSGLYIFSNLDEFKNKLSEKLQPPVSGEIAEIWSKYYSIDNLIKFIGHV
jgi:hypothetical protein